MGFKPRRKTYNLYADVFLGPYRAKTEREAHQVAHRRAAKLHHLEPVGYALRLRAATIPDARGEGPIDEDEEF